MYINHIGIYEDAAAIQAALNEGSLANPYVALDEDLGELDYNTLEPQEECYIGIWDDDGEGTYTFTIENGDPDFWFAGVTIGTLEGVYVEGAVMDLEVVLVFDDGWHMEYQSQQLSEAYAYDFPDGETDTWESGVMTDTNNSDAVITVTWDGTGIFTFQTGDSEAPINMATINPECSEEDPR